MTGAGPAGPSRKREQTMNVQIKSSSGITLVPIESRLMAESRIVFIQGEIDAAAACDLVKKVLYLDGESKEPIKLLINSEGGEVNSGMLIYDVIQSSRSEIQTVCIGRAYSMAAILCASARRGARFILPHGELMLHEPLVGNKIGGKASSIKSMSDSIMDTKRKINEILAAHTGKDLDTIDEETGYDHFFSPEEAIEFGLCDEIVGIDEIMGG